MKMVSRARDSSIYVSGNVWVGVVWEAGVVRLWEPGTAMGSGLGLEGLSRLSQTQYPSFAKFAAILTPTEPT